MICFYKDKDEKKYLIKNKYTFNTWGGNINQILDTDGLRYFSINRT